MLAGLLVKVNCHITSSCILDIVQNATTCNVAVEQL